MATNMQKLGSILTDRMKRTASATFKVGMELGTINGDMSLSTDSLQSTIPAGAYMVNVKLIDEIRVADRVAVAWCGNEPVIVAVVVSS